MLTYVADETLNSARKRRYSSRTECSDPNNKSRSVTKTINMQRAEEFNEEAKEQQVKRKKTSGRKMLEILVVTRKLCDGHILATMWKLSILNSKLVLI